MKYGYSQLITFALFSGLALPERNVFDYYKNLTDDCISFC
jgi:hypothetical protein